MQEVRGAYDPIRYVFDVAPLPVSRHDLEGDDGLAPQERDGAAVCVPLHPDVLRLLFILSRARKAIKVTQGARQRREVRCILTTLRSTLKQTYVSMKGTYGAAMPMYARNDIPSASNRCCLTNVSSGSSSPNARSLPERKPLSNSPDFDHLPKDRMKHVQMVVRHKLVDFRKERVESLRVSLLARRADNCRQQHRYRQIPQHS